MRLVRPLALGVMLALFGVANCGNDDSTGSTAGAATPGGATGVPTGTTSGSNDGGVGGGRDTNVSPDTAVGNPNPKCVPGDNTRKFYFTSLALPTSASDFAFDLNGDGQAENQFGALVAALAGQNVDMQSNVTLAMSTGAEVHLLEARSSDVDFVVDGCARARVLRGQPKSLLDAGADAGTPDFDVDNETQGDNFIGQLATSAFNARAPAIDYDVQLTLKLSLFGSAVVTIPLHGGHVSFDGKTTGQLASGKLRGAVLQKDIDEHFLPDFAAAIDARVQANPSGATEQQLLTIFDTGNGQGGGCTNPGATTSAADDGHIGECEVTGNALIKTLFAVDVQMFENDKFSPSAQNATKDSMSFGVGFVASTANF